jgi:hypothetical protein
MPGLVYIGAEQITVSSTVIGPTASEVTPAAQKATFQHKNGGLIYHLIGTPTENGTAGEFEQGSGDIWDLYGHDAIANFKMVKQAGEVDATIAVQYWGSGG